MNRYHVLVIGEILSTHDTVEAARKAATDHCREIGLDDDGAYCGDDGWPTIVDAESPDRHVDYDAP